MVDRTDLDALLIGALYGELAPADEARWTAHLESHPADRTALDDLTRTRAAIRDSRILTAQLDPPQAISALLLQEASRRAPRARTDRGEAGTWFQRFVRSFMAHPAMAAAATLVLVVAAAGTFYLRGADQFARSEAPVAAPATPALATGAETPSAPARAPEPEAPEALERTAAPGAAPAASAPTGAGSGDGLAADPSPPAQLDGAAAKEEGAVARGRLEQQADLASDRAKAQEPYAGAPYEKTKAGSKAAVQDAQLQKQGAVTRPAPAKADKASAVRGIELRTPQLEPKDFKDSDDEKPRSGRDARTAAGPAGGGAPAGPPASPPPPPAPVPSSANAPAPRSAAPAGAADFDVSPVQQAPAPNEAKNEAKNDANNAAKRRPAKPSPNQLTLPSAASAQNAQDAQNTKQERRLDRTSNAASNANNASAASGDAKQTQSDRTLLEWARKQREQVIAYVNANRCLDAASTAVEIYNRAPDYYNANVATDRQIKPCLAYVNQQRDRADRARAYKNANDAQAPAAPTRK